MIFCAKLKHAEPRIGLSVSLTMTVFDLSSKRHAGLFEFEVDVIIRELGAVQASVVVRYFIDFFESL
jgi:hypothetical protein